MIDIGATCMLRVCNCDIDISNATDHHANINFNADSNSVSGTVNVTGCVIAAQPHL